MMGARSSDQVIRVAELTKHYDGFTALDRVSFSVTRGEYVGYLGPNGAGKTTTIRVLLGLIKPSSGVVEVLGHDVTRDPKPVKGKIGYVQQSFSLELGLTVEENLDLYGYLWGLDRVERRRRIRELLEALGLEKYRKAYPSQLSIGLRRLVQVAREFLHDSEILFLDEPTTGLDPVVRRRVLEYVREWSRRNGATVFLTTHIPQDIERLCNRIILLCRGRVKADMSIDEFKRVFGGLTRLVLELNRVPPREFIDYLSARLRDHGAMVVVEGRTVKAYARGDRLAETMQEAFTAMTRHDLRAVFMKVEEPTLEDALIKAYLGEGA